MYKALEYLEPKILDEEKYLKQFINKEKKQVKEFYNRYMGLYDSGVEYELIYKTSDEILFDLLLKEFSDIDFKEYECAKIIITTLKGNLNSLKNENYMSVDRLLNELNKYVVFIDGRMNLLLEKYEKRCKSETDRNSVFGSYNNGTIVINLLPCYLFSIRNNLKMNHFVLSTYAHELAHFFNHLGKDNDELQWLDFYNVEEKLIEGLAQYYAKEYMKEKGYLEEFEKENNLVNQGGDFLFHEIYREYRKYNRFSREQVSNALLFSRRNNIRSADKFLDILDKYYEELPHLKK